MSFAGIANSAQMNVMAQALNQHCSEYGVVDHSEREHLAALATALFFAGSTTAEEIVKGLRAATELKERRRA